MTIGTNLRNYRKIAGDAIINEIFLKAEQLSVKHLVCISSTYQGGGVAELLNGMVFLLDEVGIDFGWRILHGSSDFFTITKKFHNALQGEKINLTARKKEIYYEVNRRFSKFTHLYHDLVIVHDPQPLPLIDFYKKRQPWIFRCHIDLSQPDPEVWDYLKTFITRYDHMVVSHKDYIRKDLLLPQSIIYPAIDPLAPKNEPIYMDKIRKYLTKFDIDVDRPIISQISRFDKWKDPIGVIRIFEQVRTEADCQLVLLGSFATDDPEGQEILGKVEAAVAKSQFPDDIKVIILNSDILVNCLQRRSVAVIQKSLREGFGLTVSEALYKGTPVVASRVGGIPLQVIDGVNGFLHNPKDVKGFAASLIRLLNDTALRDKLGKQAREHIVQNFLITRLLRDWLDLFSSYSSIVGA